MEDFLQSKEAMEEWKSFIGNANVDIFDVLKNAIKVAAYDNPTEFRTRRDKIAEMLFSRELTNYSGGGDMVKKQSMNASCEVQNETVDNASKGPLTPEQKVAVKRIGDESELVVGNLVKKLQRNTDNYATGVGKTFHNHESKDVSQQRNIDEWLNKSRVVKPEKPRSLDMERKINSAKTIIPKVPRVTPHQQCRSANHELVRNNQKGSRVAPDQHCKSRMNSNETTHNKSCPTNTSFREKLEGTKRMFQQHYMEEENLKKKRRIQVLELHEVIKIGRIPPKDQQSRYIKQFRR